jgi:hypothetical protein
MSLNFWGKKICHCNEKFKENSGLVISFAKEE